MYAPVPPSPLIAALMYTVCVPLVAPLFEVVMVRPPDEPALPTSEYADVSTTTDEAVSVPSPPLFAPALAKATDTLEVLIDAWFAP